MKEGCGSTEPGVCSFVWSTYPQRGSAPPPPAWPGEACCTMRQAGTSLTDRHLLQRKQFLLYCKSSSKGNKKQGISAFVGSTISEMNKVALLKHHLTACMRRLPLMAHLLKSPQLKGVEQNECSSCSGVGSCELLALNLGMWILVPSYSFNIYLL